MNTPWHASDEQINEIWEAHMNDDDKRAQRILGPDMRAVELVAQALATALNPETIFRQPKRPRAFDLVYSYTSYAPIEERWECIDKNTYDGAPDAEAPCTFIGRGPSEKRARMDLLEQFAEFDGYALRPQTAQVIHRSPFEPAEYGEPSRDESED